MLDIVYIDKQNTPQYTIRMGKHTDHQKRDSVMCVRMKLAIKQKFESLAKANDESASSIARKCLNCFVMDGSLCEIRRRYFNHSEKQSTTK